MEWLDIVDENGLPTGQIIDRQEAHEKGIRHRTSHVWIVRQRDGRQQLIYCGQRRFTFQETFHGKVFWDHQVSNVYLTALDWEEERFTLQKEEISEVRWFALDDVICLVQNKAFENCIFMEELLMIREKTGDFFGDDTENQEDDSYGTEDSNRA